MTRFYLALIVPLAIVAYFIVTVGMQAVNGLSALGM